jgi:hypothetical protein
VSLSLLGYLDEEAEATGLARGCRGAVAVELAHELQLAAAQPAALCLQVDRLRVPPVLLSIHPGNVHETIVAST